VTDARSRRLRPDGTRRGRRPRGGDAPVGRRSRRPRQRTTARRRRARPVGPARRDRTARRHRVPGPRRGDRRLRVVYHPTRRNREDPGLCRLSADPVPTERDRQVRDYRDRDGRRRGHGDGHAVRERLAGSPTGGNRPRTADGADRKRSHLHRRDRRRCGPALAGGLARGRTGGRQLPDRTRRLGNHAPDGVSRLRRPPDHRHRSRRRRPHRHRKPVGHRYRRPRGTAGRRVRWRVRRRRSRRRIRRRRLRRGVGQRRLGWAVGRRRHRRRIR